MECLAREEPPPFRVLTRATAQSLCEGRQTSNDRLDIVVQIRTDSVPFTSWTIRFPVRNDSIRVKIFSISR